ncbi:hypothetical protein [uncultured Chitinophaga sp.]|jgi:hypothetical protein|uniref:hypothetical protein n=1 Tax=uncultured Chitinophaga sp. TaxID=339340 RepID=UPI00261DE896|nr:hypothetical protein [uncultured Chitinophaga sp.]
MAQLSESILKVIAYFDMFSHPVTMEEIHQFLDQPAREKDLESPLRQLLDKQFIWRLGQFYSLRNDPQLVQRRLKGNMLAVKRLKLAMRISRVLAWCPYIRGVGISGSLSKKVAYEGSDYDFFIITAENRLWIARAFQYFFVKSFSWLGLRYFCCLNYYIDEKALEIEEKNIFTATEVVTLLPARGRRSFQNFSNANKWVSDFIPNASFREPPAREISSWPLKRCLEWMLNSQLGDRLDNAIMKYFSRRWTNLMSKKIVYHTGFVLGSMVVEKHLCKPMPQHFQQNILNRFEQKIADMKNQDTVIQD